MANPRQAVVLSKSSDINTVRAYLPNNYTAQETPYWGTIIISGVDNSGWTLDDFVLPRLASGLHTAVEVRYLGSEDEDEWELFFNGPDAPAEREYGREYFLDALGDALVPLEALR